jgi:hypothetical protein
MLFREAWHETPMVIDMGHPMVVQDLPVAISQRTRIPQFDRLAKILGKGAQKGI